MNLWIASQKRRVELTRKENNLCHLTQPAIAQNVDIFGTNVQMKTKHMYAQNADIVISNQKKSIYHSNLRMSVF